MSLLSKLKKIRVQHVDRNIDGVEIKTDVDVMTDADCITMDDGDLRSGVKKMIDDRIGQVIDGAPEQLDTLKEIATELEKNQSGVSTILNKLNSKLESKDLVGYAKTVDVDSKINSFTNIDLSKYAKTSYVDDKVSKIDLSGYAKASDIKTELSEMTDDSAHRLVTDEEKKKWNSVEALSTQEVEELCDEIFK